MTSNKNASDWTSTGSNDSNAVVMSVTVPSDGTRQSNPRIDWWRVNWMPMGNDAPRIAGSGATVRTVSAGALGNIVERRATVGSCVAEDLPAVWKSSTTSPGDRQRIIRLMVERVVITMQGSTERVDVSLHWSGGFNSQHELVRTVGRYEQLADYERLLTRVEHLGQQGLTAGKLPSV